MLSKKYLFIAVVIIAAPTIAVGAFLYVNRVPEVKAPVERPVEKPVEKPVEPIITPTPVQKGNGTIKGKVTVGSICPVERVGVPCPVPPEAYTSREVILYAANGVTVIKRMHFLPDGTYSFTVPAGNYVLNTPPQGIGGSKDLPKTVTLAAGKTVEVDFSIDTGIR